MKYYYAWAVVPTKEAIKTGLFKPGIVKVYGVEFKKENFDRFVPSFGSSKSFFKLKRVKIYAKD